MMNEWGREMEWCCNEIINAGTDGLPEASTGMGRALFGKAFRLLQFVPYLYTTKYYKHTHQKET